MAPVTSDFKLIKEKTIDKEIILKISQNIMSGRIFVEFAYNGTPRMVRQKSFQDNFQGKAEAEKFSKSIKSTDQLREHFGLKKEKK